MSLKLTKQRWLPCRQASKIWAQCPCKQELKASKAKMASPKASKQDLGTMPLQALGFGLKPPKQKGNQASFAYPCKGFPKSWDTCGMQSPEPGCYLLNACFWLPSFEASMLIPQGQASQAPQPWHLLNRLGFPHNQAIRLPSHSYDGKRQASFTKCCTNLVSQTTMLEPKLIDRHISFYDFMMLRVCEVA